MTRHARSMHPVELFWSKVDKTGPAPSFRPELGPCWIWTGYVNPKTGYGEISQRRRPTPSGTKMPHRAAYELLREIIPDGRFIDHLCRVRTCVNPDHLEPVTPKVNTERGLHGELRTECSKGHNLTPENTYVRPSDNSRKCRICMRDEDLASHADPIRHQGRLAASRRWKARRRERINQLATQRAEKNAIEGYGG